MTTHVAMVIDKLRAMGEDVGTDDNYRGFTTAHMIQLLEELHRFRTGEVHTAQRAEILVLSQDLLVARTRLSELSDWLGDNTTLPPGTDPVKGAIALLSGSVTMVRAMLPVLLRHWQAITEGLRRAGWKLPD